MLKKIRLLFVLIGCVLQACGTLGPPTLPPSATPITEGIPVVPPEDLRTPTDPYLEARLAMVAVQINGRGVRNEPVLAAMRTVPRHLFVPEVYLEQAYADHPIPIGYGQTISQPYIVALMSESLNLSPGDTVLEIGTGSGYQAAVLAAMGLQVYTVEIIPELAERAKDQLATSGYSSVQVLNADGYFGWKTFAPYDAIIVTAAPDHLPQPLTEQLREGGRLIIPIGPIGAVQTLWSFEKVEGALEASNLGPVRFVPFTRTED